MGNENSNQDEIFGVNGKSLNEYLQSDEYKNAHKNERNKKIIVRFIVVGAIVLSLLVIFLIIKDRSIEISNNGVAIVKTSDSGSKAFYTKYKESDDACMYCGSTPSRIYEGKNGGGMSVTSHVCDKCASKCAFCGEKATKHYTAMLGNEMFACDDCYQNMVNSFSN